MSFSRRRFLQASLSTMAYFTLESTVPNWVARSAHAMCGGDCLSDERILVIVQLAGGNDGLNTIIPVTDSAYYGLRPNLAIQANEAITMDGINAMHPAMAPVADWYQRGNFGVIQNVGYVNPNLSHFTSMQYFEEGYVPGEVRPRKGWVAKLYDNACSCDIPEDALFHLGAGVRRLPDTMQNSDCWVPPAVGNPDTYFLRADTDVDARLNAISALNDIPTIDSNMDFIQRSENSMEASIDDIAVANNTPLLIPEGSYSEDRLGRGLKLASQVIRAGFKTRIFYVSQGGYDTHANQVLSVNPTELGNHPRLLGDLSRSLNAFLTEMELSGNLDRVLIMTFSEFGRRVEENSSLGTDHGAANSLMVMGGDVAGGIYGGQPDLGDLQRGNLRHNIDFRSVYAYVIESWLRCNARPIFGDTTYDDIIAPEIPDIEFLINQTAARNSWQRYR